MISVSADVDRLQRRLASDGHRMELPSNIVADLSRVMGALYRLQDVLIAAEKKPYEARREPLLRKIKQGVYDVEDILDDFEGGSIRSQGNNRVRKSPGASDLWSQAVFFLSSQHSVLRCRLVKRMKKIRKSLDHASEESFIFSLRQHMANGDQICDQNVFDKIGRDNDKVNLRALLLSNSEEKFSIIPIVGLGGLGKTVLAQLIFSDKDVRCNFDLHIWINLNMTCSPNSIASAIISEANRKEQGTSQIKEEIEDNPQIIMNCLQEIFHDKRCLIVLDGLWSTDEGQLVNLKKMLQGTNKIIVTTCSENVARLMHTIRPYKLGPLSEENCWTIFFQRVICPGDNSDLTRIGRQIVSRCEGMPAVVHYLGSLVRNKGTAVWNDEKQELWKLERQFPSQINIFSSMKQIYYNMPSALKSCLSYLSMFPKGSDIRMENLIRQWAALGILGSANGSLPVHSQGKKYIQELLSVFFLEVPNKSSGSGLNYTSASKILNIHSLVHEFARYVTSHDLSILDGERRSNDSTKIRTSQYALLTRCNGQSEIYKVLLTSVRAICLKDCCGAKLIEKIFSALKHVRVLDLSRCSFLELPSSICQLTQLRYIDISSSAIRLLPDQMSFLQNLEALDLSETCIQVLPDFVGSFQKLKYLNLQGCRKLRHLPTEFDIFKSLQHLNVSCCPAAHQLIEFISGFQELRFLDISSCTELQTLPESFGTLTNLEDLILSKCTRLKKLPESFGELCFLQFLNISNCCELETLPASLGRLASLEVLILSGCSRIQNLPQSFIDIAFLRILDLAGCVDLHMDLETFPNNNLENLNVDGCCWIYARPGWTANFPKLHPECLQTCDKQIQSLIRDKQACPSQSEVEISNELNVPVHDKTTEAMGSQSCQRAGNPEYTSKKVIKDSSAQARSNVPQYGATPTGVQLKGGSFFGASTIQFPKMSSCFMCRTDMKENIECEGENKVQVFAYNELGKATNNFCGANKIGEDSFGSMFRGRLVDGTLVTVKVLKDCSWQSHQEFSAGLKTISNTVHENLIALLGCCVEGSHRILVYNYLENNSLADVLLESGHSRIRLNWRIRVEIAVGVARGLAYLHEGSRPRTIHRQIKASNVLLDKDLTPKISDFGLAMLHRPSTIHAATQDKGTLGYMAPEYAIRGLVTTKADVYSFGVLLLEIVSGRCNHNSGLPQGQFLLKRTWTSYKQGKLEEIIDADLGDDLNVEEACRFLMIGLLCTQAMARRPKMSNIVQMMIGDRGVPMDKLTKPIWYSSSPL